jgi:hypothetical protein
LEERCLLTTVTNLNDQGPGSLRQAIADASAEDTVDFQQGLHGTITLTSGALTINKLLTIDGPGASIITVSGNKNQQVFNIPSPFTVGNSGLTIANGIASYGGGISNGGSLTITDCVVSGNSTRIGGFGAGIYNNGTLYVAGTTLSDNSGSAYGGGICNDGSLNAVTLTVTNSTLIGNSASGGGGGIYNTYNATLTVTGSTLTGNIAAPFADANGGGILNDRSGTLMVTTSTFSGNSSSANGGGIYNSSGGNVTIDSCTFSQNAAVTGAGISHVGNGALIVTSSTLTGNFARSQGGGIFHSGSGTVTIDNTIVAGNSPPGSSPDVMGALKSQGYNLIGDGTGGSGFTGKGDQVGKADSPINPLLGMLKDNGGPTMTMALLSGSPALNAGDPAQLGKPDQRGVVRSGGVNIGAYQASASTFLVMGFPTQITAGVQFDVTVTAEDVFNQAAVGYTGTVDFTSSDGQAALPGDYTFTLGDGGTHTFPITLKTAGNITVTITDAANQLSYTATIVVNPAAVAQFQVSAPGTATPGSPFDITVTAEDAFGNSVTDYAGTVHFSSSDGQAMLPADASLSNGTGTLSVTLNTAGSQTVTATDPSSNITGSTTIMVTALTPLVDHFDLTMVPPNVVAGSSFAITVTARDAQNHSVTGYTGTVTFMSTDPYPAELPVNYTFTASDYGSHTFSGLSMFTAGMQTLTVEDSSESSVMGTTAIDVQAAAANHLVINAPPMAVAGNSFGVMIEAVDPYGNVDTGYTSTVTLTSSDRTPTPQEYAFTASDGGAHTFNTSLFTAASQTLSAWDAANSSIRGSAAVAVTAAPADHFLITPASPSVIAGTPFGVIVTALDHYGNTDANYEGTITFTTTDTGSGVLLPAPYTFTAGSSGDNGVHTFAGGVTLMTPGDQTITATASGITGSATVTVTGPAAPPGGAAGKPPNPSLFTQNTPARSSQQALLVDCLFASPRRQHSALLLPPLKRPAPSEVDQVMLESFRVELLC